MVIYSDGTVNKYIREIDSSEIEYYTLKLDNSTLTSAKDDRFKFVETINFDVKPNSGVNVRSDMYDEVEDELYSALRQREGTAPYVGKNVAGYSRNGVVCKIYETHTQQVYDHGVAYFTKGTELARILAVTSIDLDDLFFIFDIDINLPPDNLEEALDEIIDTTTETLLNDMVIGTCSANAMYTQLANIDDTTYYSAGQTKRYFGVYYEYRATFGSTPVVTTHSHFDNFSTIAEMAFYYYMGY